MKADIGELQRRKLPRLDWRTMLHVTGDAGLTTEEAASLDAYFQQFLAPIPKGGCVWCGKQQGGTAFDAALGIARFTWGLAHGEGYCWECGYPARAFHDVGPIAALNIILQYHPDELVAALPATEEVSHAGSVEGSPERVADGVGAAVRDPSGAS